MAEIAKALGEQKVNILSCLTTTSGTEGTTHLLVDNVTRECRAKLDRPKRTKFSPQEGCSCTLVTLAAGLGLRVPEPRVFTCGCSQNYLMKFRGLAYSRFESSL